MIACRWTHYPIPMSAPASDTDEALASKAATGDRAALDELVARYDKRLVGFARKQGAREPDDIAQDVWRKVTAALPRWKSGHFRGWLFRIARNTVDDVRSRKAAKQTDDLVLLSLAAPQRQDDWSTTLIPKLQQCLALLKQKKPDFHTAVVMQMGGSSLKEIAIAQGKADDLATVKTRIFRGKQALRKCVGDEQ
jgi:RNA polymerase sigma factor (sigma-70 family)